MQEWKGKEKKSICRYKNVGVSLLAATATALASRTLRSHLMRMYAVYYARALKVNRSFFLLKSDIHWWCIFFTILSYPVAFLDATQLCRRKAGTLLHLFDCRPEIAWISSTAPTFVFGTESSHWVPHHLLLLDRIKPSGQELLLDSPDRPNPGTYNTTLLLHCASNLLLEPRKKPGRSSNQRKHIFLLAILLFQEPNHWKKSEEVQRLDWFGKEIICQSTPHSSMMPSHFHQRVRAPVQLFHLIAFMRSAVFYGN